MTKKTPTITLLPTWWLDVSKHQLDKPLDSFLKKWHAVNHYQVIKCQLTEHTHEHAQWSDIYMNVYEYSGFEIFMWHFENNANFFKYQMIFKRYMKLYDKGSIIIICWFVS